MYLFNIIDYSDLIRGKKIMEVGRVKDQEGGVCGEGTQIGRYILVIEM